VSFLFAGIQFEQQEIIRENTLLARAFGASLDDVVQAIGVRAVYGTEKLTIACETTGGILDNSS
jgi:hypothetical protein